MNCMLSVRLTDIEINESPKRDEDVKGLFLQLEYIRAVSSVFCIMSQVVNLFMNKFTLNIKL